MSVIYLAGGCFWGVQKYFDQFDGIIKTTVGYANGHTENPKYEDVKAEKTGHVETVKIEYDESLRSLNQILDDYYQPLDNFYEAEEYHQKYLEKNPQGYCHIGKCFFG